jgi:uncharacterized protein YegJ (DUF2314 family)
MSETKIFFADGEHPKMLAAFQQAQDTFKYFWRELSWEYRRIVPGLTIACVKVAFQQILDGPTPTVEHMWINEIDFDGFNISGTLINEPQSIDNVRLGDRVAIPLTQISDWLFAIGNQTYGGFSIHAMRSEMDEAERITHDEAWGFEFGDYDNVLVVSGQDINPENLVEHPMSINMRESLVEFIQNYPTELTARDDLGYTLLHRETIAGNRTSIEVLLAMGADKHAQTNSGHTACDFAALLGWNHLLPLL